MKNLQSATRGGLLLKGRGSLRAMEVRTRRTDPGDGVSGGATVSNVIHGKRRYNCVERMDNKNFRGWRIWLESLCKDDFVI